MRSATSGTTLEIGSYTITVGAGGAGATSVVGTSGSNSFLIP